LNIIRPISIIYRSYLPSGALGDVDTFPSRSFSLLRLQCYCRQLARCLHLRIVYTHSERNERICSSFRIASSQINIPVYPRTSPKAERILPPLRMMNTDYWRVEAMCQLTRITTKRRAITNAYNAGVVKM